MTPIYQEHPYHAPERGIFGDCYRAALASLLDMPLADVPHFVKYPEDKRRDIYREFLQPLGLIPVNIPGAEFWSVIVNTGIDCLHLILGSAKDDGCPHTCVGRNGVIVHDPGPDQKGLEGEIENWMMVVFVKAFAEPSPPEVGDRSTEATHHEGRAQCNNQRK